MKGFASVFVMAILLLGCRKDIQNKEAVRQAVVDYLAKRSDLMAMEVSVSAVKFNKNEADALVYLSAKGGPAAGSGMQMRYALERQGNRWVVKPRSGASPHSGADSMPLEGHPPAPTPHGPGQ